MQFQVPQFIEVEDRIFGPLTFRQFVYITGGLGSAYLIYRLLPLYLALPTIGAAVGLAAALAFFEYNGRPFILAIESGFYFLLHPKLYLWRSRRLSAKVDEKKDLEQQAVYIPKLSESKLHELAWSLDIRERIAGGIAGDTERSQIITPQSGVVAPVRTARDAMIAVRPPSVR